jgi:hypothetical protein
MRWPAAQRLGDGKADTSRAAGSRHEGNRRWCGPHHLNCVNLAMWCLTENWPEPLRAGRDLVSILGMHCSLFRSPKLE